MPNKQIKKIKLGEETYSIAVENILQKVETIDEVPTSELNLYRYDKEGISSPVVEVVSEYHEGGDSNIFAKTSTANNNSLTSTSAFAGHFDATLSNFVTIDSISGSVYTYNNNYPMNGIRLGTKTAIGYINVTFLQSGYLTFHRYFGFNGSTNTITSYDANASVIVDGVTYNFTADDEDLIIPASAGTHTIENVNGRILFLSFVFGGEAYYTYEKKHLARQEDLEALADSVETNKTEANTKHTELQKASEKNAQDIISINNTLGDIQIFDVTKSLPKASMEHMNKLFRLNGKLYQCVRKGEGEHKEFIFNLSGTSEIPSTISADNLKQVYSEISKDFADYFEFDTTDHFSKIYRNNGNIKLGSSNATGNFYMNYTGRLPINSLKIGVKAYNTKKSTVGVEIDFNGPIFNEKLLLDDDINETIIDCTKFIQNMEYNYSNQETLINVWSEESYYDENTETTVYTDKRAIITRIIVDLGEVTYEWEGVGGSDPLVKITYKELKDLRDNSQLIPGQQYRIIDYITTTTQEDTQSAGHQFDIIVIADDERTLNENARAVIHEGDDYFQEIITGQKVVSANWKDGVTLDSITEKYKLSDDNEQYLSPKDEDKEFTELLTITNEAGVEVPCLFNPDPDDEGCDDYLIYCGKYEQKKFTNPLLTVYYTISEDESEKYEGLNKKDDTFVEIAYKDIDGISTPVLYKEDIDFILTDNNSVDYGDEFRYLDDYEVDGIIYNRWAKYDSDSEGYYQILTNIIVVSNQFTISLEEFKEAAQEITIIYDKWQCCDSDGEFKDGAFYLLTNNLVDAELEEFNGVKPLANLAAWEIKYCLDNNTSKYAWADKVNGKGVIYYMKDEYNNECPYDFKNIQFTIPGVYEDYGYTFGGSMDGSFSQKGLYAFYNNSIGSYYNKYYDSYSLPSNIFLGDSSWGNSLGTSCTSNLFGSNCYSNTFGAGCTSNLFGYCCEFNTFGNDCNSNTFGNYCCHNNFDENCSSNTFGNYCNLNNFDAGCVENKFDDNCYHNIFGNTCIRNKFGNNCSRNNFNDDCYSNTFGANCTRNTFNYNCDYNTFGNECSRNLFGVDCDSNIFDTECTCNIFEDGCCSNTFGINCTSNTFDYNCWRNNFGYQSSHNSFGKNCWSNNFNDSCYFNIFGNGCNDNTCNNHFSSNIVGNECSYNLFGEDYIDYNEVKSKVCCINLTSTSPDTAAVINKLQNIIINSGVKGKNENNKRTITVERGLSYSTTISAPGSREIILDEEE